METPEPRMAGSAGAERRPTRRSCTAAPIATGRLRRALLLGIGLVAVTAGVAAHGAAGGTVTTALPNVMPTEFNGDLGRLPRAPLKHAQRPDKPYRPLLRLPAGSRVEPTEAAAIRQAQAAVEPKAAMPGPAQSFEGIARGDTCTGGPCSNANPSDANGEVGPDHYIQAVNFAYAIYSKSGTLLASFTEDQLWAGDSTSCNGQSRGDPVVLYDALADRWILAHFAFGFSGNDWTAPFYQCIAVSKSGDPVTGGWWLYPVRIDDEAHPWLNDYAKFGIWNDCLYMAANEFDAPSPHPFKGTMFASFSRADMYAGAALSASIGFIADTSNPYTMIPSHLGGQAGAALPPGTPNYFVSQSLTVFSFEVRKFTAGPNCGAGGTLGTPVDVGHPSYALWSDPVVPQPGTSIKLDSVGDRLMQKVQYRKIGTAESLWVAQTYRPSASGNLGVHWAQVDVTGGTIAAVPAQQQLYSPDSTLYRFMPSLAVDGQGNMAVGYTTSGAAAPHYPSIAYSGRLASDPANALPQTETVLIAGGSSQTGNCGGAPCDRWGDYSSMSVDPADDCTFWLTNQYYPGPPNASTIAWQTRIGSFRFPACTTANRTADLAIAKTDGSFTAPPGMPIAYTLVATNNGPFAVTGATVTDTLPAAITGVTWTCTASAGSGCPASGTGSIGTSAVNLLNGGTATFTVNGTVSPSASGALSNTANIALPAGLTDPVPANNTATDTDTVALSLSPPTIGTSFGTSPIVIGQTSVLAIAIANPNAGTVLTGIAFSDVLLAGVTAPDATGPGCGGTVTVTANVIALAGGTLAADGNCAIPVSVTGAQASATAWTNTIGSVTSTEAGANSTPATADIIVRQVSTTTAIVSDAPDPTITGQPYTVTYAVGVMAPGTGTPTGTVTVSDGTDSCVATLPVADCQLVSLAAGAKALTATYNGDVKFGASVSATRAHQVAAAVLDVDASVTDTRYDALTDGLLVMRYLFGVTGSALTNSAVGGTATRSNPPAIKAFLDGLRPRLDIDGNGSVDALTDGVLILRYLFGLRGSSLIAGAVDPLGTRTTAPAIEAYVQTLLP